MLRHSIERLKEDLGLLAPLLKENEESIFFLSRGSDIIVYAPLRYKAYIPKRYDGWDVVFVEWLEDTEIDLDAVIT